MSVFVIRTGRGESQVAADGGGGIAYGTREIGHALIVHVLRHARYTDGRHDFTGFVAQGSAHATRSNE
jgi:hypothetical protein